VAPTSASSIAIRAKRAVASISARVRKAHVAPTRARTIASLSSAVTVGYLPRPVQQASTPQIGADPAPVDPAGNQQQQPLQSIHDETVGSGLHSVLHDETGPASFDFDASAVDPASVGEVDPLLLPLVLPVLLPLVLPVLLPLVLPLALPVLLPLVVPLVLPVLLPVDAAASSLVDPLDPDPLSSPGEPEPLELLQAASPTVDEAPITTIT
jgi:hypothetical protein